MQTDFSYDPTTIVGLIRLYVPGETEAKTASFSDTDLLAFYNIHNDPRLAAADALDVAAVRYSTSRQKITINGMSVDGPSVGSMFQKLAKTLRDRVDAVPYFDWAEQVLDAFSERERYLKQFERGQFT
ncbi:MAG TPA: hypothetical protein VKV17_12765 [Bryobacteraceae bacterium]|nr:hypothetical protein [Bryobacteraceae bacterium]